MRGLRDDLMLEEPEERCYDEFCICCGEYLEKPNYDRFLGGPFCDECMKNEINCAEIDVIYPWVYHFYPIGDNDVLDYIEKRLLVEDGFCEDLDEKYEILFFVNS